MRHGDEANVEDAVDKKAFESYKTWECCCELVQNGDLGYSEKCRVMSRAHNLLH